MHAQTKIYQGFSRSLHFSSKILLKWPNNCETTDNGRITEDCAKKMCKEVKKLQNNDTDRNNQASARYPLPHTRQLQISGRMTEVGKNVPELLTENPEN